MTQLMDYANYIAKEIGPRPAGTEEEQQAALYITEQFQKEAGFTSSIEEFASSSNLEGGRAILAGVTIVVSILAMVFSVLSIPAFILAAAAAAVYAFEAYDRPIISRVLSRGASQNVIAKYQPNPDAEETGRARTRKIILVAHYDSGRVTPGFVNALRSTKLPIALICVIGMVVAAVLLFLRIFVSAAGGGALVILNVLTVIALIICLVPLVSAIMTRVAPYNEGANNNATGTAALIEIARRISRGSVSEADLAQDHDNDISIHGERAALESGLVPEGAQLVYEAEQIKPPEELGEYDEEERLLAAKAAIAALTGKPVERRVYGSVADNLVNSRAAEGEQDEYADGYPGNAGGGTDWVKASQNRDGAYEVGVPVKMPDVQPEDSAPTDRPESGDVEGYQNAPSWFIAAQQNAKRPIVDDAAEIQRSRYTEALEKAERNRIEQEQAQFEAEIREVERQHKETMRQVQEEEDARAAIMSESLKDAQRSLGEIKPVREIDPASFSQPIDMPKFDEDDSLADGDFAGFEVAEFNDGGFDGSQGGGASPAGRPVGREALSDSQVVDSAVELSDSDLQEGLGRVAASRRAIDLPDVDVSRASHARVTSLPSIGRGSGDEVRTAEQAERSERLRSIRTNVPSLSGVIRTQNEARQNVASSLPSVVNVPTPAESRPSPGRRVDSTSLPAVDAGTASPRAQAASEEPVDYDMPVSLDAPAPVADVPSVSGRRQAVRPTSGEQGSVSMPKSRADGLIGRLRGRGDDLEETPQEWLDIDEDFDARSVGRARGGWESFRDDSGAGDSSDPFASEDGLDGLRSDEEVANRSRRKWQGGSYSRMQLGHVNMRSGADAEADEIIPDEPLEADIDRSITGEIEQIYHFRNPLFNTEIWFVAMGSDTESHDGAKAFLEEHRDELRGSMVIEVESLGVGALSVASREGRLKKISASSRIKRYTRDAVAATGMAIDEVDLSGTDSIASTIQKAGFQSMHLFGAENGKPALKGSADDLMENIDELLFDDNVNFVFELLKHQ